MPTPSGWTVSVRWSVACSRNSLTCGKDAPSQRFHVLRRRPPKACRPHPLARSSNSARAWVRSTPYAPGVQRRSLGICRSHRACVSSLAVVSLLLGIGAIGVDRAVATDRSGSSSAPSSHRHLTVPTDESASLAARDPDGRVTQGGDKRPRSLRTAGKASDGWLVASTKLFVVCRKRHRGPGLGVPLFDRGSVPRAPPASLHF
jgi:hypothetical protein